MAKHQQALLSASQIQALAEDNISLDGFKGLVDLHLQLAIPDDPAHGLGVRQQLAQSHDGPDNISFRGL